MIGYVFGVIIRVVLYLIILQLAIFFLGDHIPWLVNNQGIAVLIAVGLALLRGRL